MDDIHVGPGGGVQLCVGQEHLPVLQRPQQDEGRARRDGQGGACSGEEQRGGEVFCGCGVDQNLAFV